MYRITIDMHGSCTNGYHKTTAYKVSLTVKKVHVGCTKIAITTCMVRTPITAIIPCSYCTGKLRAGVKNPRKLGKLSHTWS